MNEPNLRRVSITGSISPDNIEDHVGLFQSIASIDFPPAFGSQIINLSESLNDTIIVKADEIPRDSVFSPDLSFVIDPADEEDWHVEATAPPNHVDDFEDIFSALLDLLPPNSLLITDVETTWIAQCGFDDLAVDISLPKDFIASGIHVSRGNHSFIIQSSNDTIEHALDGFESGLDQSEDQAIGVYSSTLENISPETGGFIDEQIQSVSESIDRLFAETQDS